MHMAAEGISRYQRQGVSGAFHGLFSTGEGGGTVESPLCLALRRRPSFYRSFSGGNLTAAGIAYFLRRIPGDVWCKEAPSARKWYLWICHLCSGFKFFVCLFNVRERRD